MSKPRHIDIKKLGPHRWAASCKVLDRATRTYIHITGEGPGPLAATHALFTELKAAASAPAPVKKSEVQV